MLNRITAIVLIFALLSTNFSRWFVFAGFEMNRNYIATKLCENRDKPWLHCNGKCFFMKKIRQAADNEKSAEQQTQKNLFQESFYSKPSVIKFHTQLLQVIAIPNHSFALPNGHTTIFRPPQLG